MSGKDALIDFATYVVGLLLFAFVVFFIIVGNRFDSIKNFFLDIIPLMIFALIGIIMVNIRKKNIKKKKDDSDYEITLFLNYGDRLSSDMILTGLSFVVLIVGFLIKWKVGLDDVIQSTIVFVVLYFYFKSLYRKV